MQIFVDFALCSRVMSLEDLTIVKIFNLLMVQCILINVCRTLFLIENTLKKPERAKQCTCSKGFQFDKRKIELDDNFSTIIN